jgi:REP element-mobilizing transposase RayT
MSHPYPPHHPDLPYKGKNKYFLTFCADERRVVFDDADVVDLVRGQILRAARQRSFDLLAYCFMPGS